MGSNDLSTSSVNDHVLHYVNYVILTLVKSRNDITLVRESHPDNNRKVFVELDEKSQSFYEEHGLAYERDIQKLKSIGRAKSVVENGFITDTYVLEEYSWTVEYTFKYRKDNKAERIEKEYNESFDIFFVNYVVRPFMLEKELYTSLEQDNQARIVNILHLTKPEDVSEFKEMLERNKDRIQSYRDKSKNRYIEDYKLIKDRQTYYDFVFNNVKSKYIVRCHEGQA